MTQIEAKPDLLTKRIWAARQIRGGVPMDNVVRFAVRDRVATPISASKTRMAASHPGLPAEVSAAFVGMPHLTMPQLAKAMGMDLKTLKSHREAQNLPVHIKGTGRQRRHYVCTLSDVVEFYKRTGESSCQSSRSETRLTTNSISKSKVIAFTALPNAKMNVMLRKSRKPGAPKP